MTNDDIDINPGTEGDIQNNSSSNNYASTDAFANSFFIRTTFDWN